MNHSELFKRNTHCIFAPKAEFTFPSVEWDCSLTIEDNIDRLLPSLNKYVAELKFCMSLKQRPVDSFVISAPAGIYSKTIEHVAEWLRRVLYRMSPSSIEELQSLKPESDGTYASSSWNFRYSNVSFFILTTTPLYRASHSRFCGGDVQKSVMILMQPLYSFEYHFSEIKQGNEWFIVKKIRDIFKRFGRNYEVDFQHTVSKGVHNRLHEAPKYLKPLQKGDSIISWWLFQEPRLK